MVTGTQAGARMAYDPMRTSRRGAEIGLQALLSFEVIGGPAASLGGLDALINNAGIAGPNGGVEDIKPGDWRRTIDVCLTGQFLCAHFAVPLLKAAGGGAIVNLSSAAGRFGYAFRTPLGGDRVAF
jgi:NAD(P)-dependent dehydrogenase (short-subunit alcohol dehydrogenase family)